MKILVTGAAGFIGMHTSIKLLAAGHQVIGIDNLSDYYDVNLKLARVAQCEQYPDFRFIKLDISDREGVADLFAHEKFDRVIHLAAQAGVRHSLRKPFDYVDSNLVGMMTILEGCRQSGVEHLVYASSSSVYGNSTKIPFSVDDNVDHPVSLYAATKKANELMAHSYAHLYGLPVTGLRFFTVYGPWGRPDMAPWLFTDAILHGRQIKVFNNGGLMRDFTYVGDIVKGVTDVLDRLPEAEEGKQARYAIYNIGNSEPVSVMEFISTLERILGKEASKEFLPMQPGDVYATSADVSALESLTGYLPHTCLETGLTAFTDWFKRYHQL